MNYQQTIDYLFSMLPMFSKLGAAAFKKDLTNTIELCNTLGNPQTKFKTIHIAGTNGKGSVSHMLAAILQKAGYKTGLYTSPHLKDFRERIKVDGQMCEEEFVVNFTQKIKSQIETIQPSFFEVTVAMAFEYFAEQKVDIAIIETGLGGRLDSTNIITPILSIITNIGLDHVQMLGNTLPLIAAEKAGIIKQNVPVVIGERHNETEIVFLEKAKQENAPILFAENANWVTDFDYQNHLLHVDVESKRNGERKQFKLDLNGVYQRKNLITVLAAVECLRQLDFFITDDALHNALQHVKQLTGLHGRWQVLENKPTLIADVAHNEDGMKQLLQQLEYCTFNHLHFITGMVKDKDVATVLSLLPKYATYYFTNANIPRALPASDLRLLAHEQGLDGEIYNNVNDAIDAAKNNAHKNDLILVAGSVFLVGEINGL